MSHIGHIHLKVPPRSVAHLIIGVIAILAIVGMLILFRQVSLTARIVEQHPCVLVQCPANSMCTAVRTPRGLEAECVPLVAQAPRIVGRFAYNPQSSLYATVGSEDVFPNVRVLPFDPAHMSCFSDVDCPDDRVCRNRLVAFPGFNEQVQEGFLRVCVPEE
ncbi:hypothetical protein HY490_05320 [Candidatus Woesearchaeota archaeon]|nr:hypothetical protein [Candidatus Woesearchaeota archaeon]